MPCTDLHGMSLVVVVFLVEELILYVERITWSCWIACGDTSSCRNGLFVGTPLYSVLEDRLKNLSLDIFSLLFFGNNSVHRIIVLVWMTGLYAGNCSWIRPYVLLVEEMQIQPLF